MNAVLLTNTWLALILVIVIGLFLIIEKGDFRLGTVWVPARHKVKTRQR
jgi:type IV secretory pathway VirB2 component (pilin)